MNILNKIIAHKREEVAIRQMMVPDAELKESVYFGRTCLSLKERLSAPGSTGIIAEYKRKSPSKGIINNHSPVEYVTKAYTDHGASGLSVLTDHEFFGGNIEDVVIARENEVPILRKEFIIDPYQLLASKAIGADVILLIAACLSPLEVKCLAATAKHYGMEVLLELHDEEELQHICDDVDMIGINNRNLKSFKVDINRSLELAKLIPPGKVKVAESGISSVDVIHRFREAGYKGFLIGETFMAAPDPAKAFENFVKQLKHKS